MSGAKHGVGAEIIERDPNVWLLTCKCQARWVGPTYEVAEDKWREHVYSVSGVAPRPMGNKANRWEPDA